MSRSNCLFWAIAAWWRLRRSKTFRRRVHFDARTSDYTYVPHFGLMLECRDGRFRYVSFKPIDPRRKIIPPPLFHGRMRWGDRPAPSSAPCLMPAIQRE